MLQQHSDCRAEELRTNHMGDRPWLQPDRDLMSPLHVRALPFASVYGQCRALLFEDEDNGSRDIWVSCRPITYYTCFRRRGQWQPCHVGVMQTNHPPQFPKIVSPRMSTCLSAWQGTYSSNFLFALTLLGLTWNGSRAFYGRRSGSSSSWQSCRRHHQCLPYGPCGLELPV